jgi:pyruvate kinase
VALSFVRSAADIAEMRALIDQYQRELGLGHVMPLRVMAKIEKHEAIRNMDEIIEAVDGIMVARGDLGIETPAAQVPLVQKTLIDKCRAAAKPVVVATQMLDSMIRNPRPTRAEVSDVANAVIDHADAVMLSGESASGKYPLEAVETMATIITETEASPRDDVNPRQAIAADAEGAVSQAAVILAKDTGAKAILTATLSGELARLVCRHRPDVMVIAAVQDERVRGQMTISWGVTSCVLPMCQNAEEILAMALSVLTGNGTLRSGDKVVFVAGEPVGVSGGANLAEIRQVP